MEPQFNEPPYNEVLINNNYSPARPFKMFGTEPRHNKPILLVPWHFVNYKIKVPLYTECALQLNPDSGMLLIFILNS